MFSIVKARSPDLEDGSWPPSTSLHSSWLPSSVYVATWSSWSAHCFKIPTAHFMWGWFYRHQDPNCNHQDQGTWLPSCNLLCYISSFLYLVFHMFLSANAQTLILQSKHLTTFVNTCLILHTLLNDWLIDTFQEFKLMLYVGLKTHIKVVWYLFKCLTEFSSNKSFLNVWFMEAWEVWRVLSRYGTLTLKIGHKILIFLTITFLKLAKFTPKMNLLPQCSRSNCLSRTRTDRQ